MKAKNNKYKNPKLYSKRQAKTKLLKIIKDIDDVFSKSQYSDVGEIVKNNSKFPAAVYKLCLISEIDISIAELIYNNIKE